MHNGFIVEIKELRPHTNADKLQLATFFGETVVVGLDTKIGDIGIYFPCDLQLSEEYCDANDLCRKKADGTDGNGYLERDKRNIKAISLRGEKSYGLYAPLESLKFTGVDLTTLKVGDTIEIVNGTPICCKYIPRSNRRAAAGSGNRTRKKRAPVAPLFAEHADTEQLAYNLSAFKPGDEIEITLKMHGTSGRTARLPVLKGYRRTLLDHILRREGTPIYEDGYVSGTRRVVLENYEGGFYGDNSFREKHSKIFEGKLHEGETAYYEIVAFTNTGTPIMGSGKVPKEAQAEYGKEMIFSYGCHPEGKILKYGEDEHGKFSVPIEVPQSEMYMYRMTLTTPEGYVVEYSPELARYRAEQMGIKYVPRFEKFIIPEDVNAGECVKNKAEQYYDGPDPIGKTHVREGVVVRIVNRPKFCAYKHKNFLFKQISGIITEQVAETAAVDNLSEDILSEM